MYTAKNYIKVSTIDEAFELNKSRNNVVMGGLMWLKQSKKNINTLIDLSGLEMDYIKETENTIEIGAMTSLRSIETSLILKSHFGSYFSDSLGKIVGVQFRNGATLGGSIWGRYGFSDVITAFLSLNATVSVYNGEEKNIDIKSFIETKKDNSILSKITIDKKYSIKNGCYMNYQSARITATDLPVLTCSSVFLPQLSDAKKGELNTLIMSIGARPSVAQQILIENVNLNLISEDFIVEALSNIVFGSNIKGSWKYRQMLSHSLSKKAIKNLCHQLEKGDLEKC